MDALALVEAIPGWLLPEDAERLYALAHATPGPVLEVGTYHGKSALLMAMARKDAERSELIYTVDVDRSSVTAAAAHAQARNLDDAIVFARGTLAALAAAHPRLRPGLTFVDGDHSRVGVERDLAVLRRLVPAGGRLVFHDFNDPLNEDPSCATIKVRPAVHASWVARECEFDGVFGACGQFTRRTEPESTGPAVVDLLRLGSLTDRYRHGLRPPVRRLARRLRPHR